MRCRAVPLACVAFALGACASGPKPLLAVDYSERIGTAVPAHGQLYIDCMKQAADAGTVRQVVDGQGEELLVLRCEGKPAQAFYEALGPWSASIGSEFQNGGRTYRSTVKVVKDLFGVDFCSVRGATDFQCALSFNAGDFLTH